MSGVPLTIADLEPRIERLPSKAAWLERRQHGIGGSDAAAVLGEHPWKSAFQLYCLKRGLLDDELPEESEAAEWGGILEAPVRRKWCERAGREVMTLQHAVVRDCERPHLFCSPDGLILAEDGETIDGLLEIKTASAFKAADWKEGVPLAYQIQVQHGLHVLGLERASFGALIGGQRFLGPIPAQRHDAFIAAMLPRLDEFWQRVVAGEPPEPDWTKATAEALRQLYPTDSGASIALPSDALQWHYERIRLLEEKKAIEAQIAGLDNHLKAAIGDASTGVLPGNEGSYSHKLQQRAGYTVAPTEFRVLRHSKPKN